MWRQWHRRRPIKKKRECFEAAQKATWNKFLLKIDSFLIASDPLSRSVLWAGLCCAHISHPPPFAQTHKLETFFNFFFHFLISQQIFSFTSPSQRAPNNFFSFGFSYFGCRQAYCRQPHFISFLRIHWKWILDVFFPFSVRIRFDFSSKKKIVFTHKHGLCRCCRRCRCQCQHR